MSNETGQGKIVGFDVETGAVAWTSERSWTWISRVDWLPDGDALLAIAQTRRAARWPDLVCALSAGRASPDHGRSVPTIALPA